MAADYHEILIIGGGPAGSAASMYLAGYGFDVCIIEKKIFPRETLCGEFLSGEILKNLENLGINREFLLLNPNCIRSFRLFLENGKTFSGDFPFDAFGMKRSLFDSFLLSSARIKGVKVIQPAEAREIYKEGEEFAVKIKEQNGGELVLKTSLVIAAYGKQNALDTKLRRSFSRRKTGFVGIKYHVNNEYFNPFDKREIHLYTGKNIYCGINYVDDQTLTLCFLQHRDGSGGSFKQPLRDLFNLNKSFGKILKETFFDIINEQKVYGTGNIYFGRRKKVEEGIIMIGDAAGVISPFAGDGIGMAFESAKLAAEILYRQKRKEKNFSNALIAYEKNWQKIFGRRIVFSGILQNFLLKSGFKKIISPVMNCFNLFPSLSSCIVEKTRS
jgi:flavin-dependent dehydrogenase